MQINFLESFLVLYEELNISKACKRLYITQQGLSKQIQSLEKKLDIILFERSKRGVIPTEIAHTLYSYYKDIWDTYNRSLNEINKYKFYTNKSLSVAFAIGLSNATDPSFLHEFQIKYPDIEFNILEFPKEVCIDKLKNNELDLAFLVNPFDTTLFECFPLAEGFMYAAIHRDHPLSAYPEPIDFSYLEGEKIITGSPQNALRELFDYFCQLENINPRIMISSYYSFSIMNSMKENIGIGTLTSKMASLITNPNIVIKQLKSPVPGYMYCAYSKDTNLSPLVTLLVNYLKERFSNTKST